MRAEADDVHRDRLLDVGNKVGAELAALIDGRADGDAITTDVATMRKLAMLIASFSKEVRLCGGEQCFGRAGTGGVRWVVADQLERAVARAEAAEATVAELRLQLVDRTPDLF